MRRGALRFSASRGGGDVILFALNLQANRRPYPQEPPKEPP